MDPKWSKRNRSSRDEKTPRLEQPFHTRASRPGPEEVVTSAQLETKHGTNPARRSHGTKIETDSRDVISKSDEPTSEKEGLPAGFSMNVCGIALQASANDTQRSRNVDGMPQVGLAVIGTPGSGKSTFVQHALDLKKCAKASPSTKKVSLEGVVSLLRIHEFDIFDIVITSEGLPQWPHMSGQSTPCQIDGVIMVYSINDSSSTSPIPRLLRACSNGALPTVIVCSKCDGPSKLRQVDNQTTEHLRSGVMANIQIYQTSVKTPDSHKRCLSFILRSIGLCKTEASRRPRQPSRPRAYTTIDRSEYGHISTASESKSKHQRVNSDFPGRSSHTYHGPSSKYKGYEQRKSNGADSDENPDSPQPTMNGIVQPGSLNALSNGPVQSGVAGGKETTSLLDPMDGGGLTWQDEDDGPKHALDSHNELALKTDTIEMPKKGKKGQRAMGFDFDELVDRLLSQALSKTDARFAAIFLCLYRAFAAPSTLLAALISRFNDVNGGKNPPAIRTTAQLRYLSVLAQWTGQYPGDFAHPVTRANLADFIAGLAGQRAFGMVIQDISVYVDVVPQDDDTAWACSDKRQSRTNTRETFASISSAQSTPSTSRAKTLNENADSEDHSNKNVLHHSSEKGAATPSTAIVGSSSMHSNGPVQGLSTPVNSAKGQARLLTPFPRTNLTKTHWHLFMRVSDEDVAQELTRIDWIMFSSIRPRDLVKYVSLCEIDKEKCKSMENITRLIDQFNHVAFWIANIILFRDKAKHRAKALEKCMAIAWASNCRLRQLNNYNSLGAVVAGISGTAVHRLYETRELVPHHVQKQFMRLEILMSTQRSHFAYRLAWSNTSGERIPFLPLHSRDLTSAEEGNPTYLDEESKCINWKKFEIIGDVIINVQRSQATPYTNISRNEEVQRLILECHITKDEDVSMILD
ncbi:MAG: hypothetical protein Q9182_006975 [Xanthomendoza sp. 2 TL-2023]